MYAWSLAIIEQLERSCWCWRYFSQRILQHQHDLYHVFIDFKKAFDMVWLAPVYYAAVEEDCTSGLVIEVFDDSDRLVLMLYFFMVVHKAACQTLSKAFLKSMKTW